MKHALRSLVRTPGFTAIAILTLALGIGLNTAMFSLINTLLLQPLNFSEPQNLYLVQRTTARQNSAHSPAAVGEIKRGAADLAFINQLLVGFAALGLLLAALGIYSVVVRTVVQRTNEIGIRMALGEQINDLVRLILVAGLRMAFVGAGLGLVGAVALARYLSTSMPALATSGTAAIAGATVLLIMIALIACYLPARRATKVDPMVALRTD